MIITPKQMSAKAWLLFIVVAGSGGVAVGILAEAYFGAEDAWMTGALVGFFALGIAAAGQIDGSLSWLNKVVLVCSLAVAVGILAGVTLEFYGLVG